MIKLKMPKKIKLIYIVGSGHSGSTLIERILGSSKNAISVGELKALRFYIVKKDFKKNVNKDEFLCTCGEELVGCKFWSKIISSVDPKNLIPYRSGKFEKLGESYFPKEKREAFDDIKVYENIISQARKQKKDATTIIESSKDLGRLIHLRSLEGLDLYAIHLVRDGRAVINSHRRRKVFWLRAYLDWVLENHLISKFLKRLDESKRMRVSYDLFAQNPEKYLEEIKKKFELDINIDSYIGDVNDEEIHTFSGNRMRFKKLEKIEYDQKWKGKLPKFEQFLLKFLTYFPNRSWVYNKDKG